MLKDAFTKPSVDTYIKHSLRAAGVVKAGAGGGSAITAQVRGLASSMNVKNVQFRPYEDILGIAHTHGISNIVVPGAGEANFDSYEANPFQDNKQARESEVQAMLNKLSHEMIGLDASFVGSVDKDQDALRDEHKVVFNTANEGQDDKKDKSKHKMRGRNKISAKLRRKQKNVIDANSVKLKEKQDKDRVDRDAKLEVHRGGDGSIARGTSKKQKKEGDVSALSRFSAPTKGTTQRKSD